MNKLTVQHNAALLAYLFEHCASMKKTSVKQALKHGSVRVNGQVITAHNHPLRKGDTIELLSKKIARTEQLRSHFGYKIIFEDHSLLVVDKPADLLTMGTDKEKQRTLYYMLTDYQRAQSSDGRGRVFIVHRLDRDASGLLIFAKTETIKRILQRDWHLAEKRYYAITEGCPRPKQGTVRSYLEEDSFRRVYSTQARTPDAKASVTHYRTLAESEKYAWVEISLETGRKNQIRVHLADLGCPIAGDQKYGAQTNPLRRLALHAHALYLNHPISGKSLSFEIGSPENFKRLVDYSPKKI